ncbi:hypothetical protein FHU10_0229 [Serratia fonticola]|uniref:RING-type E3 ubiquitin transferase n=1 Tax=Serratia fonticola TaxID=47917 RepID=A0A542D5D7_SERFO|nr:hypothetical protein [Serratia fonticola]TQI79672.1 hypothetical protein FHU09_2220 [Serratia fonticola]TQI98302.1 hypothetical protein FHU11_3827 [Serratia fonticola]TVZ67830.1 hypothetical protein FHU10_0229 [Serratia fonticola]
MPILPLAIIAAGIGAFITITLTLLYRVKVTPVWLPSALLTTSLIVAEWVKPNAGAILAFVSAAVLFIMAIVGSFYNSYLIMKPEIKTEQDNNKNLKALASIVLFLCFPVLFFLSPGLLFLFVIVIVIFANLVPSNKSRYLKLQKLLPTSKISALAMGLVEIEGEVNAEKRITSPLTRKKCLGYRYTVLRKEDDRHEIVSHKEECLPLTIKDETGSVAIDTVGLEWVNFSLSSEEWRGKHCHREYILEPKKKIVLIGSATLRNQKIIIVKDKFSKVFAMSPSDNLSLWNEGNPLMRSAIRYAIGAAFLIALILTIPYQFDGNVLTLYPKDSFFFNWLR